MYKSFFYDKLQVLEPKDREVDEWERLQLMERPLLSWYQDQKRTLPWRDNPTPYSVWISEIMLQQTRVEAVKPYYQRFMEELPGISDLAVVSEDRLLKLWEGLGYYSRARNLQKAARIVTERYNGELPTSFEELLSLPGIGSYTAGAIASIAFHIPVPAVDGNVLRVFSRLTGSEDDILKQSVKRKIEGKLREVMPSKDPGSYNQALIELGALVCIPNGYPLCDRCPMASLCIAKKKDLTSVIPVKTPKKQRKSEDRTVLILLNDGKVAIQKRKDTGLLASMYEFPNLTGHVSKEDLPSILGVTEANIKANIIPLSASKHIFSHVEWHMIGYWVELKNMPASDYLWVEQEDLKKTYSLPGAFKAYAKLVR